MFIDQITVHALSIPFKMAFGHARKQGKSAESLVVQVQAGTVTGYGEGAPRVYVTGEDLEGACNAVRLMARHPEFPWKISGLAEIRHFITSVEVDGLGNAARCAVETALIDAFAKVSGTRAVDLFPGRHRVETIRYGATIPLSDTERISRLCHMMNDRDIHTVRVKLGTNLEGNSKALGNVREICGPACDLRVDINGAWDMENFLSHLPVLSRTSVKVVEQPFPPGDNALRKAAPYADREGFAIMADEEACDMDQVERIIEGGCYHMVNIRLSKCGGIHLSLSIAERLRKSGVSFQVGCQLGESGILSAAGRTLGLLCGDALYYDGSYDAFLLEENVTKENVSFGTGGKAGALGGPGFGVEIDPVQLARMSNGKRPLEITRK